MARFICLWAVSTTTSVACVVTILILVMYARHWTYLQICYIKFRWLIIKRTVDISNIIDTSMIIIFTCYNCISGSWNWSLTFWLLRTDLQLIKITLCICWRAIALTWQHWIIDICYWVWMEVNGDYRSLDVIKLQISTVNISVSKNLIADIKNEHLDKWVINCIYI